MNPLTNMKNVKKLSEQELKTNFKTSWHDQYRDSAWIFVGGLPFDLTEGDIICIFSQYGEIVNLNLIRDKVTGKSRGFCFICYEDQRSTVLAVDNFNGIKILNRTIRVDHVADYKVPKDHKNIDSETRKIHNEGCAPSVEGHDKKPLPKEPTKMPKIEEASSFDDIKLPERLPIGIKTEIKEESASPERVKEKKEKKSKKEKRKKKDKKNRKRSKSSSSNSSSESSSSDDEKDKNKRKRKEDKPVRTEDKRKKVFKSIFK